MRRLLLPFALILLFLDSRAQNTFPASGNTLIGTATDIPSAILNINSNTKGVLIPRLTTAERDGIVSPVMGLIIYNTATSSLDYYTGTAWVNILSGSLTAWGLTGNSVLAGQFLGSTNNENLRFRTNNIERMVMDNTGKLGIGKTVPTAKVDISDADLANGGALAGSVLNIAQTWNTGGTPTAIKLNVAHTASGIFSNLIDLQVNGVSAFKVARLGSVTTCITVNTSTLNVSNDATFGGVASGSASGNSYNVSSTRGFIPSTGTAAFAGFAYTGTINQTGGASGFTRGIYISPTLTSAADWRSIEFTNSAGWGLYGAGSAKNYLAGKLLLGTTTDVPSAVLNIASTTKGALLPRMTTALMNGIASPADGLLVYNTDESCFYYYKSNTWAKIGAGDAAVSPWSITGTNTNVFNTNTGSVFIGLTAPGTIIDEGNFKLYVDKGIRTKKVKVDQATWADYVFETDYPLPTLDEVDGFIKKNNHLPGVLSAAEVEKNGVDLGDNQVVLLKKIEELTLYIIEQKKQISDQNKRIEIIEKEKEQLQDLQQQISELKKLVSANK